MQKCLDDILDDSKFPEIIKDRLSEWDGNLESDKFIAVWSAADYRMKYYNTLADGREKIERLMDLFKGKGFIPQFDVCGPPTMEIQNVFMAPRGDLVATLIEKYDARTTTFRQFLTIISAGTMRPLLMIVPGTTSRMIFAFSNNSRYIAVLSDDHVDVWDIFNLRKISTKKATGTDYNSIIKWSSDDSCILIRTSTKTYYFTMENRRLHTISSIKNNPADIALNEDGTVALFLYTDGVVFVDTPADKVVSAYTLPITYSGTALVYPHDGAFTILAGGYILRINSDREPEIIKDYRGDLELSMTAKRQMEFDKETPELRRDWRCISVHSGDRIVFEYQNRVYGGYVRCTIDPTDLSYEINSDTAETKVPDKSVPMS